MVTLLFTGAPVAWLVRSTECLHCFCHCRSRPRYLSQACPPHVWRLYGRLREDSVSSCSAGKTTACIHYDAKQAQVSKRLLPEVVSCGSPNQLLLKFGNHFHVHKICAAAGRRVVQSGYVVVHWCSRPLPFSNISNSCLRRHANRAKKLRSWPSLLAVPAAWASALSDRAKHPADHGSLPGLCHHFGSAETTHCAHEVIPQRDQGQKCEMDSWG